MFLYHKVSIYDYNLLQHDLLCIFSELGEVEQYFYRARMKRNPGTYLVDRKVGSHPYDSVTLYK